MLIKQTIINFIEDKTESKSVDINDNIHNQLKSFDFMLLIINLENNFQIKLPFEQALSEDITQISQFVDWVEYHYVN